MPNKKKPSAGYQYTTKSVSAIYAQSLAFHFTAFLQQSEVKGG
jgi:hypothetical protein